MSLLTKSYPTKEWFHLFHVRKGFREEFAGKRRTLSLPCRLVYGYLVMRIKKKPRPTSKRMLAAAFGMHRGRLSVFLKLLQDRGLVAPAGDEWYASQPSEQVMADWFVPKGKTEADTWHGRLAGVPVLLRSGKAGLSNLDAAVLSLVYNFHDQKVQKYRGAKALANFLGSTPRTILKSLRRLAGLGFLALNNDGTRAVQVTTSPTEEQLAFFKDKRKTKQPIAQALDEVSRVDQLLEGIRFDPTPPHIKAKLKAEWRLRERKLSPVGAARIVEKFAPDVILRVDQDEPGSLTWEEFAQRCREITAPTVTMVQITEDRSDSLVPRDAHPAGALTARAESAPTFRCSPADERAIPALKPAPQTWRRGPHAPQLSPEDTSDLKKLLAVLSRQTAPEGPFGDVGWLHA